MLGMYWLSLLSELTFCVVALAGAIICHRHLPLSRHLWLARFGFLTLSGVALWQGVVPLLLITTTIAAYKLIILVGCYLLPYIGFLGSWLAIIVGLNLVFRDVRERLENYAAAWRLSSEEMKGENTL